MGAAGTALGAADARMNEHYEIGTILTQKSQGERARAAASRALRILFSAAPALGMAVVRRDHLLFAPQVHNQGLATSVSILMKPMGQKGRELPSQVAGGYTSGRRAGGGAGAQAHFPGDPEG